MKTIVQRIVDEDDLKIIDQLVRGKTLKEAAKNLSMKFHKANYRVRVMRQVYDCTTTPQLIKVLHEQSAI